jgi:hypothetical protein
MWCGYTVPPVYYKIHVRRFRKEMQRTADVPAIQAWLKETNLAKLTTKGIPIEKQPECVRRLSGFVFSNSPGTIVISHGSGFGHWGVEIAAKGTLKPPWSSDKYSIPLSDGAWVWSDDH